MEILWQRFEQHPYVREYEPLKTYTEPIGRWPAWRDRALALMRERVPAQKQREASWGRMAGHSALVEVFLWEGHQEAAWQEAQADGCSSDLWMQLAEWREQDHPEDAIAIYRRRIDPLIEPVTNGVYDTPVSLVLKVGELMRRMGRDEAFLDYVEQLRTTYKRKRNFVKLLDSTLSA